MYRGARPFGPRAAIEFEVVYVCMELDAEDRAEEDTEKAPDGDAPLELPDDVA